MKENAIKFKTNNSETDLQHFYNEIEKYKDYYAGKGCFISGGKMYCDVDYKGNIRA